MRRLRRSFTCGPVIPTPANDGIIDFVAIKRKLDPDVADCPLTPDEEDIARWLARKSERFRTIFLMQAPVDCDMDGLARLLAPIQVTDSEYNFWFKDA
jgi:hypothetical protein